MVDCIWNERLGEGPLVAVAVHDGHGLRDNLTPLMNLTAQERLREEDPFTGSWTSVAPTQLIGTRSRFEVDLNRPREKAVYRRPEDAWGLPVWNQELPESVVAESLAEYDLFFDRLREVLDEKVRRYGRFVVLDLHTYNHRRLGSDGPVADPISNPQVNIGTGTMDRTMWGDVVDGFMFDLQSFNFPTGPLDVRENVKFQGGNVPRWIHENYGESGCAIAVEFKKFFMDEWTGAPDAELTSSIGEAIGSTVPGIMNRLSPVPTGHAA